MVRDASRVPTRPRSTTLCLLALVTPAAAQTAPCPGQGASLAVAGGLLGDLATLTFSGPPGAAGLLCRQGDVAAYYAGPGRVRFKRRTVVIPSYTRRYVADAMKIYCRLTRGLPGR